MFYITHCYYCSTKYNISSWLKSSQQSIHKKYQMPNIDTIIDCISKIITNYQTELHAKTFLSTIVVNYAYSPLKFHPNTAEHSNYNIASGNLKGAFRLKTGLFELNEMPAGTKKAKDYTLIGLQNSFWFIDDILIVIKGS